MSAAPPLLEVEGLEKVYRRGWPRRSATFRLSADFTVDGAEIVGVMGPNGSGKTTLFELITGSNRPSRGTVRCAGRDIHRVRTRERDRLAIHYHQSYQVRRFRSLRPDWLLEPAGSEYPWIHLFDEPQFNTQDGYIGFMLGFFRALRARGRLVFLCLHPNEPFHLEILRDTCERFVFVSGGRLAHAPDFETLMSLPGVAEYLGALAPPRGPR